MHLLLGRLLLGIALLGTAGSTLCAYPHQLAYFNEGAGGRSFAIGHLLGSSFDWGQDLLLFGEWMSSHPEYRPIALWGSTGRGRSFFSSSFDTGKSQFVAIDANESSLLAMDAQRRFVASVGVVRIYEGAGPISIPNYSK
jgi:hypothetical protein